MKLRIFVQVLAVNTIMVFLRSLKYLQAFSRVKVIFNTFYRGAGDIACFLVVTALLLVGYLAWGHQLFGSNVEGFRSIGDGIRYCFLLFQGHFQYSELRSFAPHWAPVFFYSYMFIFRFVI